MKSSSHRTTRGKKDANNSTWFKFDPDTPRELSTVRFAAAVTPANEDIVWLVDGAPVGKVGYPHELRWHLSPGTHVIRARLAQSGETTAAVTVVVDD